MALIGCPECGREVSSSAVACPECAYPVAAGTPPLPPRAVSGAPPRKWGTAVSIVGRIVAGGALTFTTLAGAADVAVVMAGLLVAGSAIPVWFRRKQQVQEGRGDAALVDGLEERLADLEQRHLEQITDLEERIDFAERVLTKQRDQIGPE